MNKKVKDAIKKYGFEFFTIFLGIFAAFTLDRWNDNRKDHHTETKILLEISNGLNQDLKDIAVNEKGHKSGLEAVTYLRNIILNKPVAKDSFTYHYFNLLRSFISIQNTSGYETLKSKGLEIIDDDSLRTSIIALYENHYNSLLKIEEKYNELQFQENYYHDINNRLAPNLLIDGDGNLKGIKFPINIAEADRNILLMDLWKIKTNRLFALSLYEEVKNDISKLQKQINKKYYQ